MSLTIPRCLVRVEGELEPKAQCVIPVKPINTPFDKLRKALWFANDPSLRSRAFTMTHPYRAASPPDHGCAASAVPVRSMRHMPLRRRSMPSASGSWDAGTCATGENILFRRGGGGSQTGGRPSIDACNAPVPWKRGPDEARPSAGVRKRSGPDARLTGNILALTPDVPRHNVITILAFCIPLRKPLVVWNHDANHLMHCSAV